MIEKAGDPIHEEVGTRWLYREMWLLLRIAGHFEPDTTSPGRDRRQHRYLCASRMAKVTTNGPFMCVFCLSQADARNALSHVPVRIVLVDFVTKPHNLTWGDPETRLMKKRSHSCDISGLPQLMPLAFGSAVIGISFH